jgi:hypothetical protein
MKSFTNRKHLVLMLGLALSTSASYVAKGANNFAPPVPAFAFEQAQQAFAKAAPLKMEELVGNWRIVGSAEVSPASDSDMFGFTPGYSEGGLLPASPSIPYPGIMGLSFHQLDLPNSSGLAVTITNISRTNPHENVNQGPYAVMTSQNDLCFSQYGVVFDKFTRKDIIYNRFGVPYVSFVCRKGNKTDSILCQLSLNGDPNLASAEERPYVGKVIGYTLYKKL